MTLNLAEIGERLRIARENAALTQAVVAERIQVARTTLVAIEQGLRQTRAQELSRLAKLYGTTANALMREEAVYMDIAPRFRKSGMAASAASKAAARLLSDLVRAEVELENILGIPRMRNYPPERPLLPGDVRLQAETDAAELRQWLGLGRTPVRGLTGLLELELGMRVYVRKVGAKIAGLFAHDSSIGACMLLNARHSREQRLQTAGHELGHFMATRQKAEMLPAEGAKNSREERYADAFGRAFLTPARTVMQKFQEITAGAPDLTRRQVVVLAYFFGITREAMVRRLEELRLVKAGTWDSLQAEGGIPDAQARQILGELAGIDAAQAEAGQPTTLRLSLLAAEAWRRELLSEGQLAQLLRLDRVTLRALLDGECTEEAEANGMPQLSG